jgi:hypothetical protein
MKIHKHEHRPLMYLSGNSKRGPSDELKLKSLGCDFRCYSYAYTCPDAFYYVKKMKASMDTSYKAGVGIMMDSSAHSFHVLIRKGQRNEGKKFSVKDVDKLRDKVVESYVDYVKHEKRKWDWYVNFDYVQHAPTCYTMLKQLEKMGIHPVPVYHAGDPLSWFERYCEEGYKLIGIGIVGKKGYDTRRYFYDKIFNIAAKHGVLLHGFAMTALSLMYMYPWYSVDSATWLKVAIYGSLIYVDEHRHVIGELHVTERNPAGKTKYNALPKHLQKQLRSQIEENGFNFRDIQKDYAERSLYNAYVICNKVQKLKKDIAASRKQWRSLLI